MMVRVGGLAGWRVKRRVDCSVHLGPIAPTDARATRRLLRVRFLYTLVCVWSTYRVIR